MHQLYGFTEYSNVALTEVIMFYMLICDDVYAPRDSFPKHQSNRGEKHWVRLLGAKPLPEGVKGPRHEWVPYVIGGKRSPDTVLRHEICTISIMITHIPSHGNHNLWLYVMCFHEGQWSYGYLFTNEKIIFQIIRLNTFICTLSYLDLWNVSSYTITLILGYALGG